MKRLVLAATLAVAFAAPLSIAGAATATDDVPTARVTYNHLTLGQPAADAKLKADIQRAARQVCSEFSGTTLADRAHYNTCYAQAVGGAQRQVMRPAPTPRPAMQRRPAADPRSVLWQPSAPTPSPYHGGVVSLPGRTAAAALRPVRPGTKPTIGGTRAAAPATNRRRLRVGTGGR